MSPEQLPKNGSRPEAETHVIPRPVFIWSKNGSIPETEREYYERCLQQLHHQVYVYGLDSAISALELYGQNPDGYFPCLVALRSDVASRDDLERASIETSLNSLADVPDQILDRIPLRLSLRLEDEVPSGPAAMKILGDRPAVEVRVPIEDGR